MSAFAIYAFTVTGLYILYMGVTILMDFSGKKNQKKDGAEEFNNSDMNVNDDADEGGTLVDETPDGYSTRIAGDAAGVAAGVAGSSEDVSDDDAADGGEDSEDDVAQQEQPVDDNLDDEEILNQEMQQSQADYESLKAVQEQMESVSPQYQDQFRSEDFAVLMHQPLSTKTRILRAYVNI